ncbi:hypothetical protein GGH13_009733 [Coemansia sp. S155-1]|nr:hypothetical protein GGH13_009733 [Coemansia sp. S155-1]
MPSASPRPPTNNEPVGDGTRQMRIPDISAIDIRSLPGASMSFADFEALTLMRMRLHQDTLAK